MSLSNARGRGEWRLRLRRTRFFQDRRVCMPSESLFHRFPDNHGIRLVPNIGLLRTLQLHGAILSVERKVASATLPSNAFAALMIFRRSRWELLRHRRSRGWTDCRASSDRPGRLPRMRDAHLGNLDWRRADPCKFLRWSIYRCASFPDSTAKNSSDNFATCLIRRRSRWTSSGGGALFLYFGPSGMQIDEHARTIRAAASKVGEPAAAGSRRLLCHRVTPGASSGPDFASDS